MKPMDREVAAAMTLRRADAPKGQTSAVGLRCFVMRVEVLKMWCESRSQCICVCAREREREIFCLFLDV